MFTCNFATIVSVQITAAIISFNEEENIAAAIESVAWADEILVVDSESTDRTREIAETAGARVICRNWAGFSAQKQFAADEAANEWVFSLDADERVSPELAASISELRMRGPEADGYKVSRLPFYMGKAIRHGGWYPDKQVRLFNRAAGKWKNVAIHESIEMRHGSKVGELTGDIIHYTVKSAQQHHRMIGERYAPLGARQMLENCRTTGSLTAAADATAAFLKTYLVKLGFLDGFPGFCIAWFAAHNVFLKHLILLELKSAEKPAKR